MPEFYSKVCLRQLLTHTSGIPDFLEKPVYDVYNNDIYNFVKRQDKLEFDPGSKYNYSNTAFILLAMIVEKVAGISYPDYLDKTFFSPLNMKDTFVGKTKKKKRIVSSYHISGKIDDRPNYYFGDKCSVMEVRNALSSILINPS